MIEIKLQSERAQKTFERLAKRIKDLNPIWDKFIPYWQKVTMPEVWDSKGKLMEGQRWESLTEKYLKWKRKNYSGRRLLELTGKLFEAVQGGSGWYERRSNNNLEIGIQGEEYFYWIQYRKKNPRFYFHTKDNNLPPRVWAYLTKITDEYLEEADSDK